MADKYDDIRENVSALLAKAGVTYAAEFVPQSKSRNALEKEPSLNWRVTLTGAPVAPLTTDYMQGIGHVPNYNALKGPKNTLFNDEYLRSCAERGRYGNPDGITRMPLPVPHVADVVHSLVLDSDVINYGSFEEWASEFGYDSDSRKAERVYQDCMVIALKLRQILGDELIAKLRDVLQDY